MLQGILRSLKYPSMNNHYEDVIKAHQNTFKWAFFDSLKRKLPWDNIPAWLKSGDGVYWVCGKVGSGKSTLMKHIFDAPEPRHYLQMWAGKNQVHIAPLFFWNSGNREKNHNPDIYVLLSTKYSSNAQKPCWSCFASLG